MMEKQPTIERHDAKGMWLAGIPSPLPEPPLQGDRTADIVIVGGGYSGMWAAWWALQHEPETSIVILESGICGHGPSGRNGGFAEGLWARLAAMREEFGDQGALELGRASEQAVDDIGEFCRAEGVDARFRKSGYMQLSTAPVWDGAWEEAVAGCRALGVPEVVSHLSADEAAARCSSPHLRGGAFYPGFATVDPARLGMGLRERLLAAGVRIHENTPVRETRVDDGGDVIVRTRTGSVRAGSAILALGGALGTAKPWRRRLTMTSSHIVATEPVPDLLEEIGWTGGECITDFRAMIHYFRTTADGRIVFGWGGGRVVPGSRLHGRAEVDPEVAQELTTHLLEFFPGLEGRRLAHAWGGPIDVSPSHLPQISTQAEGKVCAAFGFTGNGVGPSCLLAKATASIALGRRDPETRLPVVDPKRSLVPPEPFRYVGGTVIRSAMLRVEHAAEHGREPGPVTKFVASLPERLGVRVGR